LADALPRTLDEPGLPTLDVFTASDGYRWHYRKFAPPQEPAAQAREAADPSLARRANTLRGRVIFIHGIQSHGGWYPRSCAQIAAAGYEVYFLDRRGSGLNRTKRGDAPGFRRLLDDIAEFIRALPNGGLPKYLAAISWGGKLGVALPYRHPGLVDGLALLCPGLFAKVRPSFVTRTRITLARVARPTRLFGIPLNDPKLFTTSTRWQRYVAEEPLGLRRSSARLLFSSFALDIYLRRAWKLMTLPVLLLLSEKDEIVNNAKVRAYVEKLPAKEKRIIEYPGAHHTLEFEPEDHPFVGDLIGWLERCSSRTTTATSTS
jgi:alpha-beta hydrolase superfamily lysophospholipase